MALFSGPRPKATVFIAFAKQRHPAWWDLATHGGSKVLPFQSIFPWNQQLKMVDPSCCCRAHSRQMLTSQHWTSAHRCQHKSNLQGSPMKTRDNHQNLYIQIINKSISFWRVLKVWVPKGQQKSHQVISFGQAIPGRCHVFPGHCLVFNAIVDITQHHHFVRSQGPQPCSALHAGAASEVGLKQLTTMQWWWRGGGQPTWSDDILGSNNAEQW